MAFKLAEAFVRLFTDDRDLKAGFLSAEKETTVFSGKMKSALGSIARIAFPIGVGAGLIALTRNAINSANAMKDLSTRTGIAVEELSRLDYAAKFSDTSIEELAQAVRRLSQVLESARGGSESAIASLAKVGVAQKDLAATSPRELLYDVAEAFATGSVKGEELAVAFELLGRRGQELMPFLKQGREELARLFVESDRVGHTISTETARAAAEFNDRLKAMKLGSMAVANTVVSSTLPAVNSFARYLSGDFARDVDAGTRALREFNDEAGKEPKPTLAKEIADEFKRVPGYITAGATSLVAGAQQLNQAVVGLPLGSLLVMANSSKYNQPGVNWAEPWKRGWTDLLDFWAGAREEIFGIGEEANKAIAAMLNPPAAKGGPGGSGSGGAPAVPWDAEATSAFEQTLLQLKMQRAELEGNASAARVFARQLDELAAASFREMKVKPELVDQWLREQEAIRGATAAIKAKAEADQKLAEARAALAAAGFRELTTWEAIVAQANEAGAAIERVTSATRGIQNQPQLLLPVQKPVKGNPFGDFMARGNEMLGELSRQLEHVAFVTDRTVIGAIRRVAAEYRKTMSTMDDVTRNFTFGAERMFSDLFVATFKGNLDAAIEAFRSFADAILREVANIMAQKVVQMLFNFLNNLFPSALPTSSSTLPVGSGVVGSANGNILRGGFRAFASGGVVSQPTLGLVGEGRYNEAVVPLPDGRSIPVDMHGGQEVVVPVSIHFDPMSIANALAPIVRPSREELSIMVGANIMQNGPLRHTLRRKV